MWEITLALVGVFFALWFLWRKKKFSLLKEAGIPGPEPSILFGNLWEYTKKGPLECQKEWVKKYGRVFGYYYGMQPVIVVADLELLKKIQISDFHNFINRPQIFGGGSKPKKRNPGFSNQITNLRDKRWKEIRSILTPSFTTSKMRTMAPIMNKAIDSLIENVDAKAKEGKSFDIYPFYQGLTMDVIGRTSFGIQTDVQRNPNDPLLRTVRILLSGSISSYLAIIGLSFPEFSNLWILIRRVRWMFKNKGISPITELVDTVSEVIKIRREGASKRRIDLLQLMVDAEMSEADMKNVTGEQLTAGDDAEETEERKANGVSTNTSAKLLRHMTDEEILDNSVLFFLAGYETTSTALAFTTHFLVHYPNVQERIRQEVKGLIAKEGTLDYTSVQKLQYLDQVFNESLRMYPPIFSFINREAGGDVTFENMQLKKGSAVQVPVHLLQHDPEFWSEPEKFDPERFSPENKSQHHPLAWQPFGAGPRNCVGMRFAQMEAKLAIARILLKYRLVACDETDKESLTLRVSAAIITPAKGIILKAIPC